jgi:hypothetical protein
MSSTTLVHYLRRLVMGILGLLVFMNVMVAPMHAAEGPNLISNGDFRLVREDGTPDHWYVNVTLDSYQVATADSLRTPGERALRLVGTNPTGRAFVYYRIPVEEGQRYVLRFWHRTQGAVQPGTDPVRHEARVEFINAEQNKLIAPSLFYHLPMQVDDWTFSEHTFVVPKSTQVDAGGERIPVKWIWVHLRLDNAIGETWFAAVELREITTTSSAGSSRKGDEAAVPSTYYLSPSGDDTQVGSREKPWRTLEKASVEAEAGDTVILLPGVYSGILQPVNSGTPEAPITFKAEEPLTAILTGISGSQSHAVRLYEVAYIQLEGFRIQPVHSSGRWVSVDECHDIRIDKFFMSGGAGDSGLGNTPFVIRNSEQVQVRDSVLREFASHDMAHVYNAKHILFEGNAISRAGHSPLAFSPRIELFGSTQYVVLRGNVFHAGWGRNFELFGESDVLFEGNIITGAYDGGLSADPQAKFLVDGGIVRFNRIFRNWGIPISGSPYHEGLHFRNIYIYHNVFAQNATSSLHVSDDPNTENVFIKNNIFSHNNPLGADVQLSFSGVLGRSFRNLHVEANAIAGGIANAEQLFTLEQLQGEMWRRHLRQEFVGNLAVDPGFASVEHYNHALLEDSPLRDAGAPLTRTVGQGSGKVITVEQAGYFYDGFGIHGEVGDLIAVGSPQQLARVLQVDRKNNTLTLDKDVTWQDGDPVGLPWSGAAPDIGAYEHGSQGRVSVQVVVEPFTAQPGEPVRMRAIIHGQLDPVEYTWYLGDGTITTGAEITHVYKDCYDYPIRVRVADAAGRSYVGVGYVLVEDPAKSTQPLLQTTFDADDVDWWWLWYKTRPAPVEWERVLDATGNGALRIQAPENQAVMPLNTHPTEWSIDQYPYVRLRYRLTPGTPYGLYIQGFSTPQDDRRIFVAVSPAAQYAPEKRVTDLVLVDDGHWHELEFDVRVIREKYPDMVELERLGFIALPNNLVKKGAEFWLDEAYILPNRE